MRRLLAEAKHKLWLRLRPDHRRKQVKFGLQRLRWRRKGVIIPSTSVVDPSAALGERVSVGEHCYINAGCRIESATVIGDHVGLGHEVLVLTGTHAIGAARERTGKFIEAPSEVESGCWVGARATILPGVTVARGCVIAAGAIVTKSTQPNGLYAGVPAKRIRDLPTE